MYKERFYSILIESNVENLKRIVRLLHVHGGLSSKKDITTELTAVWMYLIVYLYRFCDQKSVTVVYLQLHFSQHCKP